MKEMSLRYYWIEHDDPHGPLGYGVTAFEENDVWRLLDAFGYERYASVRVREIKSVEEIPDSYVRQNMGPIVVRGVWYPFSRVGVD